MGTSVAFIDHPVPLDDGGWIATVDRSGDVKKLSESFATAQGLAWAPNGEIWFTAARVGGNRSLHAATPSGRVRELLRVPGNLTLQDIARDGRPLLTRETWRREIIALPPGESKERGLTWLDWSLPAAISMDGKKVLFSESGEGGGAGYSVYLRGMDGSPAVRLGEGSGQDLSADGEWALAVLHPSSDPQLVLYPTGAGEPRLLSKEGLSVFAAAFMPDGKQILFSGSEPGHRSRIYLRGIDGGKPRAVTPEGYRRTLVTPDGKWVVAGGPDRKTYLYPLAGGEPTAGARSRPGRRRGRGEPRWPFSVRPPRSGAAVESLSARHRDRTQGALADPDAGRRSGHLLPGRHSDDAAVTDTSTASTAFSRTCISSRA